MLMSVTGTDISVRIGIVKIPYQNDKDGYISAVLVILANISGNIWGNRYNICYMLGIGISKRKRNPVSVSIRSSNRILVWVRIS